MAASISLLAIQTDVFIGRKELIRVDSLALFLCVIAPLTIYAWNLSLRRRVSVLSRSWQPVLLFFLIGMLAIVRGFSSTANLADGGKFILFPLLDAFVFVSGVQLAMIYPTSGFFRRSMFLGLMVLFASLMTDCIAPGTFSDEPSRAAGFGVNPNIGAALMVCIMIAVLRWDKPRLMPYPCAVLLCGFVGVFVTFSRAGLVCYVAATAYYVWVSMRRKGTGAAVILLSASIAIVTFIPNVSDVARERFAIFGYASSRHLAFFGDIGAISHGDDRMGLALASLSLIAERPILGWGTGYNYTLEKGSHNLYLARWVDNGILGVLLYIAFLGSLGHLARVRKDKRLTAIFMFVSLYGLFSHNLLENRGVFLVVGLIAGLSVVDSLGRGHRYDPKRYSGRRSLKISTPTRGT